MSFSARPYWHRYIGVFLIRNTQGSILEKGQQDTTFAINETEHIDFQHLAMACRINMQRYQEGTAPYITFINTRSVDSIFFQEWIGVTDLPKPAQGLAALGRLVECDGRASLPLILRAAAMETIRNCWRG